MMCQSNIHTSKETSRREWEQFKAMQSLERKCEHAQLQRPFSASLWSKANVLQLEPR